MIARLSLLGSVWKGLLLNVRRPPLFNPVELNLLALVLFIFLLYSFWYLVSRTGLWSMELMVRSGLVTYYPAIFGRFLFGTGVLDYWLPGISLLLLRLAFRFLVLPEFIIFSVFDVISELTLTRSLSVMGGRPVSFDLFELIVAFEGDLPRLDGACCCK